MVSIFVEKDNINDEQVVILKVFFENKSDVIKDDLILEYETSKAVIEVIAPENGILFLNVNVDDEIDVGSILFSIGAEAELDNQSHGFEELNKKNNEEYIFTKSAQKKIDELGIKKYAFDKKFINEEDVINAYGLVSSNTKVMVPNEEKIIASIPSLDAELEVKKIKISISKKTEIKALSAVQHTGLTSTIFSYVDYPKLLESGHPLISNPLLPIIICECANLLLQYPQLNGYFEDNFIKQYVDINIGLAIDLDNGLKVYSIKNTNTLDLKEIETSLSEGIYAYFKNKLSVDQLIGSTFTVSDLSAFNVDRFIPLINYKQAAILGISSVDKKLERFSMSLTFDHRVTEGRLAAKFLSDLVNRIEEYSK